MSGGKVKLVASRDQMRSLYEAADRVRKGARSVSVDREALLAVLGDHSKLIGEFKEWLEGET